MVMIITHEELKHALQKSENQTQREQNREMYRNTKDTSEADVGRLIEPKRHERKGREANERWTGRGGAGQSGGVRSDKTMVSLAGQTRRGECPAVRET